MHKNSSNSKEINLNINNTTIDDPMQIAEKFNYQFSNVVNILQIPHTGQNHSIQNNSKLTTSISSFPIVTENELKKHSTQPKK